LEILTEIGTQHLTETDQTLVHAETAKVGDKPFGVQFVGLAIRCTLVEENAKVLKNRRELTRLHWNKIVEMNESVLGDEEDDAVMGRDLHCDGEIVETSPREGRRHRRLSFGKEGCWDYDQSR